MGTTTQDMKSSQTSVHASNAETIPSNPLIKKRQPLYTPSHAGNLPLTPFGGGNPTDTDSIPPGKVTLPTAIFKPASHAFAAVSFALLKSGAKQRNAYPQRKEKQPQPTPLHLTPAAGG
jgi:hypothetical protein